MSSIRFIMGGKTENAMKILGIRDFPFTTKILKRQFSVLLKTYHPDKGGTNEQTIELIEAYNWLKNLTQDSIPQSESAQRKRDEPFSLWVECEVCGGTGKRIMSGLFKRLCSNCEGRGWFWKYDYHHSYNPKVVCKECNGNGVTTDDRVIKCYKCHGLGEYELKPNNPVIPKGAVLF